MYLFKIQTKRFILEKNLLYKIVLLKIHIKELNKILYLIIIKDNVLWILDFDCKKY